MRIVINFQLKTYLSTYVHISLQYISILIDDTILYIDEYVCNLDNTKFKMCVKVQLKSFYEPKLIA